MGIYGKIENNEWWDQKVNFGEKKGLSKDKISPVIVLKKNVYIYMYILSTVETEIAFLVEQQYFINTTAGKLHWKGLAHFPMFFSQNHHSNKCSLDVR